MLKRIFDFLLSFLLIIFLLPLLLLISILIIAFIGSPIIFKQQRPGLNGKIFNIYKFRTMTDKKNETGEFLPDEQRMTEFGSFLRKTSLDELPELWNILNGEMSFVGPRPLLVEYLELYDARQNRRHEVRPGLTGWAQINGRNAISWEEKFELDLWYVENKSMMLDIKILWLTFWKVIKREGINQQEHVTVEKFKGNQR